MKEKTFIADAVEIAKDNAEYDGPLKNILADKSILAWIASCSVKELRGYPIDVIKSCIEGEPEISKVPVAPGQTNEAITGENTEDKVAHEGTVYFDIRFTIITPGKERIKLIINIEAQKNFYPGYDLVTRGVYYGARMLSSQKEREFTGSDYDNIKKVYSIWICLDAPSYAQNTITEYSIQPTKLYGDYRGNARYDLMSVVMICLGDPKDGFKTGAKEYQKLLDLLTMISSHKVPVSQKLMMLEQEYHIATTRELKEGFSSMCNWSEGIIERIREDVIEEITEEVREKITKEVREKVTEEVREKVIEEVREKVTEEAREKVTEEVREKVTEEVTVKNNVNAIVKMIQRLGISFEAACEVMQVNPDDYAELVEKLKN